MTVETDLLINYPEDSELAVVHLRVGDERCNRDDMKGRQTIDPETAGALVALGEARYCATCYPKEDPAA